MGRIPLTIAALTPSLTLLVFSQCHFTRFAIPKAPLAWLGVGLGLTAALFLKRRADIQIPALAVWLALLSWGGLGLLWTADTGRGALEWLLLGLAAAWTLLVKLVMPDDAARGGKGSQGPPRAGAAATKNTALRRQQITGHLLGWWLAGGALCGALALAQRLGFGPKLGLHQVTGTIGNPNHLAGVLLLLLPAAGWLIGSPRVHRRWRALGWLGGGLCLAGIVASGSKSALLALVVVALFWLRRRVRPVVLAGVLLVCALASFHPGIDPGVQRLPRELAKRAFIARVSYQVWASHPVRGAGLGGYPVEAAALQGALLRRQPEQPWSNLRDPHNLPMTLLCQLGIVGTLLFLLVVGAPLLVCLRRAAACPTARAASAAWLGLAVHGLADSALFAPVPMLLAFGWLALAVPPREIPAAPPNIRWIVLAAALSLFGLAQTARHAHADRMLVSGLEALEVGQADRALRDLDRAVAHSMAPAEPLFYRGALLAELGRLDAAARDLEGSFRRLPSPERATAVGNLELRRGRPRRAVSWFGRAIALHPRYTPAYNNLGVTHLRMGDAGAARRYLLRARSLRPGDRRVARSWRALEAQLSYRERQMR